MFDPLQMLPLSVSENYNNMMFNKNVVSMMYTVHSMHSTTDQYGPEHTHTVHSLS